MRNLRRHCYFVVFLCIISLIVPFHIFAQPGGAGTTDKAAGKAGEDAGTAAEAGISAGTIAMGVVAAAVVIGTVAIAGGSTGGTAPAPQTTTVHH